jgi:hypothetical protein
VAGTVIIPWYATGFRGDRFEQALNTIAAAALRYGASSYAVYRARDDRYKFQQLAAFEDKVQWERYWEGTEMVDFRVRHSGWYQVPVTYSWWDLTAGGAVVTPPPSGNGRDGRGGGPRRVVEGESA